jgi:hypothetical protein
MPNDLLRGFESGLVDSFGLPFERFPADFGARDGELLRGPDGKHYLIESGRLREVTNPSAIGRNPREAQPLDLLSLLRTEHGPFITSRVNDYGVRSAKEHPVIA